MSAFITDGGKRFRPIFANIGYLGAGHELRNEVLRASIALELVHVCALIHDDLMDGSDMRRNRPAIHKFFENVHTKNSYEGVKERFGAAAAILLGDLALVWADRAFHESGISNVEIATSFPIFTLMREELMAGQYLDVLEGALATRDIERSLKVARFRIITSCGALQRCESLITELRDRALLALRSSAIDRKILPMLEEMALVATERNV
ncbi:MAG: hypothetical protein EBW21_00925 [Actinobacteria bacterium]|nr:hypothetical protein [Actinomycetota bacterium]